MVHRGRGWSRRGAGAVTRAATIGLGGEGEKTPVEVKRERVYGEEWEAEDMEGTKEGMEEEEEGEQVTPGKLAEEMEAVHLCREREKMRSEKGKKTRGRSRKEKGSRERQARSGRGKE